MKKTFDRYVWILIFSLFPLCAALAESEAPSPWEKVGVRAGGFYTGLSSDLRLGLTAGTGLTVSLEDTLGLDSSLFVFRGDVNYRFSRNRRHRFDLSWAGYFRNATRTLQEEIVIGGDTIPVGTEVDTTFNFQIIKLLYSWSFIQDARVDLAFGGGFYMMPLNLSIKYQTTEQQGGVVTVPLPALDFRADILVAPKLYLREKIDIFYLAAGGYSGSMFDLELGLEYRIWKHFGAGVALESFKLKVKSEEVDSAVALGDGSFAFDYTGLLFYAKFYY
jgi:hypothetical protein